jgi:hypothetical protein
MIPAVVVAASAGGLPPRGALVGIVALVLGFLVLDRIPLSAYRPREDDQRDGRTPRRCRSRAHVQLIREDQPTTIVRRLDQPAITARTSTTPVHRKEMP